MTARSFVPRSRRTGRLAVGVALGAVAIGGNLLAYTSLHGRVPVVQVVTDVPAGELISRDMVRTVDVDADGSVAVVPAGDLEALVGHYAKVRLVAGSLVTWPSVQDAPLVSPGHAVVALQVPESELPVGLRERVPVRLVLPGDADTPTATVDGRVVGLPRTVDTGVGAVSVTVEVAEVDAVAVAAADDVRVVLLVPFEDPAAVGGGS